jgi:hypothetical protein
MSNPRMRRIYIEVLCALIVQDSTFVVSAGEQQRPDWGHAWQVEQSVHEITWTNVNVIDDR